MRKRERFMAKISGKDPMEETLNLFPNETFQTQISFVEDFLVPLSALLESEQGSPWKTLEAHSLLKCLDLLGIKEYLISSLRMSKDSSITTEEKPLESSSKSWMAWGMTVNGNCLTAKTSESHNTEKGFSLSQILEENPDPKYFLSESSVEALLRRTNKNIEEGRGFFPTFLRP
jgi:hypothetical protein